MDKEFKIVDLNDKETFNNMRSIDKWDVYKKMNGSFRCKNCKTDCTPERAQPFPGLLILCDECDCMLTKRTGGGQSDPFEWELY